MKLFFWHNIISPHQAPLMTELAGRGHQVTIVTKELMSRDRSVLGWTPPALPGCEVIVNPTKQDVAELVGLSPPGSVHVIAGARGTVLGDQVKAACLRNGRSFGLITESPDWRGGGGILRRLKYGAERLRVGPQVKFILAMGQLGEDWFLKCGYQRNKVFPFCYVTNPPIHPLGMAPRSHSGLYVGRLLAVKGVDILIHALQQLPSERLTIVGDGPERESLQRLSIKLGVDTRLQWRGSIPSDEVYRYMASAAVVLLPSRKDGWGAVVNEALQSGTPVICSSACGATDLIRKPFLGSSFKAGNAAHLANAWGTLRSRSSEEIKRSKLILEWATVIHPQTIATYFEDILAHVYRAGPRPTAPWRRELQTRGGAEESL